MSLIFLFYYAGSSFVWEVVTSDEMLPGISARKQEEIIEILEQYHRLSWEEKWAIGMCLQFGVSQIFNKVTEGFGFKGYPEEERVGSGYSKEWEVDRESPENLS